MTITYPPVALSLIHIQMCIRDRFKMNCKTDADGKVNSVLVTIYDSLEQMYGELCLDLDLHSKSGTFKYKKNKDDLLMDFL